MVGAETSVCAMNPAPGTVSLVTNEWWAWVQNGNRFALQNQEKQDFYVVAESGANLSGTWYYERNAGLMIGPVAIGGVTGVS